MEEKLLLLGDQAVALGAIHAGITGVYAYPGTPSTEITEYIQTSELATLRGVHSHWCTNEKTAMEAALGVSYVGKRALVCMKHVGLNVAADAFVNSAVTGTNGGLVVLVADDPSMHSSQNEQDSRFYGKFAFTPMLEPSSQQEAYDMMSYAFDLSEQHKLPVLMRITTRMAHSRAVISPGRIREQNELGFPDDAAHGAAARQRTQVLRRIAGTTARTGSARRRIILQQLYRRPEPENGRNRLRYRLQLPDGELSGRMRFPGTETVPVSAAENAGAPYGRNLRRNPRTGRRTAVRGGTTARRTAYRRPYPRTPQQRCAPHRGADPGQCQTGAGTGIGARFRPERTRNPASAGAVFGLRAPRHVRRAEPRGARIQGLPGIQRHRMLHARSAAPVPRHPLLRRHGSLDHDG